MVRPPPSPHQAPLEALGLVEPALGRLSSYLDLVAQWSPRVNLTGARTPTERAGLLVEPVLPVLSRLEPGSLVDVGSGNGSPGLVLALLRGDLEVTLLEPRVRRWAFLREVARRLGVRATRVVRCRHDEFAGPPSRTVTVRALSLPLAELAPLVLPGGQVFVWGGGPEEADTFELRGLLGASRVREFVRLPG